MSKENKSRGFTLIELLVVISIIAILSAIVLASLQDARRKGRDAVRIRSMIETRTALQMYFSDKGYYPDNTNPILFRLTNANPPYITSINQELTYKSVNDGTRTITPNTCGLGNCMWYHMAIPLETKNSVLLSDADVDWGTTNGGPFTNTVDGLSNVGPCYPTNQTGDASNDVCYDLTSDK